MRCAWIRHTLCLFALQAEFGICSWGTEAALRTLHYLALPIRSNTHPRNVAKPVIFYFHRDSSLIIVSK
jgi:hypothetical protein